MTSCDSVKSDLLTRSVGFGASLVLLFQIEIIKMVMELGGGVWGQDCLGRRLGMLIQDDAPYRAFIYAFMNLCWLDLQCVSMVTMGPSLLEV